MTSVLVGTVDGLDLLDNPGPRQLAGHRIDAIVPRQEGCWVLSDSSTVWLLPADREPVLIAESDVGELNCMLPMGEKVLLGGADAHILDLYTNSEGDGGRAMSRNVSFESAPGRDTWYTPWGGPPDVRSLAVDVDGTIYVNVHVGGIVRLRPGEETWQDTMDIDADVHQVVAHPDVPGLVMAATARGLAITTDGGSHWAFHAAGLHAAYSRAVTLSGDRIYISVARGSRGNEAAVYRTDTGGTDPNRCENGLPAWFSTNVDTGCLAAKGQLVVIGDAAGTVYRSDDAGETWKLAAEALPAVTCVAIDGER